MKTHPGTGKPYPKGFFTVGTVMVLLALVAVEVEEQLVVSWTEQERHEAGDWAIRVHFSASDNLNRVPERPEHVPDFRALNRGARTVMEL
jgi:hypothetical protein